MDATRDAHPGVSVGISTARTPDEVCTAVVEGSADIGLLAVSNGPLRDATVRIEPLFVQGYVIVARDPEALPAGVGPVPVRQLRDLDLVVGQLGTGMRRVADSIPASTGCRVVAQVEQREALLPLVLAGQGVAVVADSWRDMAQAAGLTVRTVDTEEILHVALVLPPSFVSPAAERFCAIATTTEVTFSAQR
ncbi:LysR family transcriptional regulator substrate-binding protein [Pseudonocardia nantongensis]|uniref:LysR family transcriptional regulator substrate-binding protein n=1 Tax=Pseudonocardia nantongensis TaxID=1181885 RepID=UPI00397E387A